MKLRLPRPFLFVAALAVVAEEWWWGFVKRAIAHAGRVAPIARADAWVRRRSKREALGLFVAPLFIVVGAKLVGLAMIVRGQVASGLAVFIVAKTVTTVLYAWLWQLSRPALLEYPVILRMRNALLRLRDRVHAWLGARPFYRWARLRIRRLRAEWRDRRRNLARRGRVAARPPAPPTDLDR